MFVLASDAKAARCVRYNATAKYSRPLTTLQLWTLNWKLEPCVTKLHREHKCQQVFTSKERCAYRAMINGRIAAAYVTRWKGFPKKRPGPSDRTHKLRQLGQRKKFKEKNGRIAVVIVAAGRSSFCRLFWCLNASVRFLPTGQWSLIATIEPFWLSKIIIYESLVWYCSRHVTT